MFAGSHGAGRIVQVASGGIACGGSVLRTTLEPLARAIRASLHALVDAATVAAATILACLLEIRAQPRRRLRLVGAGRFEPGQDRWLPGPLEPGEEQRVRRLAEVEAS